MQEPDGTFRKLFDDEAAVLRRIAGAGGRELPIFGVGEVVPIRGGNFRVLALDGRLLVLSGVSTEEADAWYFAQSGSKKLGPPVTGPDEIIEIDDQGAVRVGPAVGR